MKNKLISILDDPIKSYKLMETIDKYKDLIRQGVDKYENGNAYIDTHKKIIKTKDFNLIEI